MRTNEHRICLDMIHKVAEALGPELRNEVVFVGGVTTALFVDEIGQENVRHTEDVDLIISVFTQAERYKLIDRLQERGFSIPGMLDDASDKTCSMKLDNLEVDLMPTEEAILGFSNLWYPEAYQLAQLHHLTTDISIKLIKPVYFIATKIVAYYSRGNNDPLGSKDLEDLLTLFNNRDSLVTEILDAKDEVKKYIALELIKLMSNDYFVMLLQSTAPDPSEYGLLTSRIKSITQSVNL